MGMYANARKRYLKKKEQDRIRRKHDEEIENHIDEAELYMQQVDRVIENRRNGGNAEFPPMPKKLEIKQQDTEWLRTNMNILATPSNNLENEINSLKATIEILNTHSDNLTKEIDRLNKLIDAQMQVIEVLRGVK